MTRPAVAFAAPHGRLTALEHRRRLKASPLYRRREKTAEQAQQRARVKALFYLSDGYYERYHWAPRRRAAK